MKRRPDKSARSRNKPLANALGQIGKTLTKTGDGSKIFSGAFTTVAGKKVRKNQQTPANTNLAVTPAGRQPPRATDTRVPPIGPDKKITPEQTFDTSLHPGTEPTAASLFRPGEAVRVPIKTTTDVSQDRVQQYLLARFNPIRGLSAPLLARYLEQFDLGFVRWASLVFNKIRERDDAISAALLSREAKPADMGWEIVAADESPEAAEHRAALDAFYHGLSVTHILDQNQRGGVSLLIRQMMRAVGDKFAVHEMVWVPTPDGLTAEFKYCPLWFFENRTGQLRFLPYELALQGVPLEPGGWMVHVGEGLFQVLSILYLYKQMGLKSWVAYMDKYGIPFLHGKTQAQFESAEWNSLVTAMQNFASDGGIVTTSTTTLEPIIMSSGTGGPHEPFCDRMDRAVARVVRGGDLSQMSRGTTGAAGAGHGGGGMGSLPQMENENALAKADAERISETLNFYVDRWVIGYHFGEGTVPKARFAIQPPQQIDVDREIQIDSFLLSVGVPVAIPDLLERYERALPEEGESLAHAPQGAASRGNPGEPPADGETAALENRVRDPIPFRVTAQQLRAKAQAKALEPLRRRLVEITSIPDAPTRNAHLEALRQDLPAMLGRTVTPQVVEAISESLSAAVVTGAVNGARQTTHQLNGHRART